MTSKLFLSCIGVVAAAAILISLQIEPVRTANELDAPAELDPSSPSATAAPATESPRTLSLEAAWNWSVLETNDLAEVVTSLRSAACPEPILRDIVIGLVRRRFNPLFAKLGSDSDPFWQTLERRSLAAQTEQASRSRAREQLEDREKTVVRELLGVELDEWGTQRRRKPDTIAGLLEHVSEQSRPGARAILQKFDRLERAVSDRCSGTLGIAEESDLEQLYSQKVNELRSVLSSEEIEEFELRASPLAYRLKTLDLVGFSPTEQEFRAIFRIAREQGDLGNTPGPDPREEQLKEALGDRRIKDYQRSQDLTYRNLVEFTSQFGYGPEIAAQVHDLRATGLQQVDSLAGDPSLEPVALGRALAQLQADAVKSVSSLLGEEAYGRYLGTPMGRWIKLIPGWTNGVAFHDE